LIVTEFDLGHGGSEQFNNGSNLTANKSLLGHIPEHGDFGKKFHLPHLLILKNIARNKSRNDLAAANDPAATKEDCALAMLQIEVNDVPNAVLIGSSEYCISFLGRVDQSCAKVFRVSNGHTQEGMKDSRFMPSARMFPTQTIVSNFLNLDYRRLAVR